MMHDINEHDVRQAAQRLAAICREGRREDAPCPDNCPGLVACGRDKRASSSIQVWIKSICPSLTPELEPTHSRWRRCQDD